MTDADRPASPHRPDSVTSRARHGSATDADELEADREPRPEPTLDAAVDPDRAWREDPLRRWVNPRELTDLLELEREAASDPTREPAARRERERLTAEAEVPKRLSSRHERRVDALRDSARRGAGGYTLVYSLRLDPDEIWALERRAARLRMKPTALARNIIRAGLQRSLPAPDARALVDELDLLANRMRESLA